MVQDRPRLLERHARKQFRKFTDRDSVFEVLEQCRNRSPQPKKEPSPADAVGVTFDRLAG
jgi:hypothetical protein